MVDKVVYFSLIIPTRNRSEYISSAVNYFLRTDRDDVEVIVTDCSDRHDLCLSALKTWLNDSRLVVLDNSVERERKTLSMVENWSYGLDQAKGKWITFIGDDDVCDPQVVYFIEKLEKKVPNCMALTWHRAHFDIDLDVPREAKIPMGTKVYMAAGLESVLKNAEWPNPKRPPSSLASNIPWSCAERDFRKNKE